MEFRIEYLDYGTHGVVAQEPRTNVTSFAATKEEARREIESLLRKYVRDDFVPPPSGPYRTIETFVIEMADL